ncbi:MAG: hypothetical protein U1E73_13485 [Planctomycetota bacterium]
MTVRAAGRVLPLLLAACAAAPRWQDDLTAALSAARAGHRDLVVFFTLAGRDASDRMQQRLGDPLVLAALADGGFDAVVCDGFVRQNLYKQWVGFGEGMGVAVLDGSGRVYATRPGPQDPPEFAAFVRLCAASRAAVAAARTAAAIATARPEDRYRYGCLLQQLGNRNEAEPLLLDAAYAGLADARHRVARLYAVDGNLVAARRWLATCLPGPAVQVTEGYLLFRERRHGEAVAVLEKALAGRDLGEDRQRAQLFLGKALHEVRRDADAVRVLEGLAGEGTGSTFEGAALHTLGHIKNPEPDHTH